MEQNSVEALKTAIQSNWPQGMNEKVKRYVGKFFDRIRVGKKIVAKVEGNHDIYTVSIEAERKTLNSSCSCYIGGNGHCHHCHALAVTFLNDDDSFKVIKQKKLKDIHTLTDLQSYLKGTTLDSLLQDLKSRGISQKEFAESIGMNPRHLSSIKSSEMRNRYYNELGASKLACLWVLEHFSKT